jgi:hypothetical protein
MPATHKIVKGLSGAVAHARIARLEAALEQIKTVCTDNAPADCDKAIALQFVCEVAADALRTR